MLKSYFILLLLFAFCYCRQSFATHNRAGEITVKYISTPPALIYEATITMYVKTSSNIPRPTLTIYWGDGDTSALPLVVTIQVAADIEKRVYVGTHSYSGPGVFTLYMQDPNRNGGVVNMSSSISEYFYVETQLVIDPFQGANSSPVLLQPPIDDGCVNKLFVHNPGAYDPDGDSLSYDLTFCKGFNGVPVAGYFYPPASNVFSLNPFTGEMIWDVPLQCGEYNVAFYVREWRNGVQLGYVGRDMQITIVCNCPNSNVPALLALGDYCVEAGDNVSFTVTASDADGEVVTLTATGGPLQTAVSPATFTQPVSGTGTVSNPFSWNTTCDHVQKNPWQMVFKVTDGNQTISLADFETVNITVVAPAPQNLTATPIGDKINLSWNQSICPQAKGYKIYRRNGFYGFVPGPCETGVPAYTGYQFIAQTTGLASTSYTDDNNGAGLAPGISYCYMVIAFFDDGAESYASLEECTQLKRDIPVITNVDVLSTDVSTGSIFVQWSKPQELDTLQIPGPYEYRLFRSTGFFGTSLSYVTTFFNLNDTFYTDAGLNTVANPYSYRIEFWNLTPGNTFMIGKTQIASSVFLSIAPTDEALILSWEEHVPWTNDSFEVTRIGFGVLDTVAAHTFTDKGLINGISYCYFIKSIGNYSGGGFVSPILNKSQENCAVPVDNVPPCAPDLMVTPVCSENQNMMVWNNPNNSCADDVELYEIYYSSGNTGEYQLIATIPDADDTTYQHIELQSITGCYKVIAVDTAGNKSEGNVFCIDSCRAYVLPNVFTPDGDNLNDLFHPCDNTTDPELQEDCPPYNNVKDVDMKIFNRWGNLVFETTDPDVNWNGKVDNTGSDCPEGVYYYICIVNFTNLDGIEPVKLNGFVHIIRGGK